MGQMEQPAAAGGVLPWATHSFLRASVSCQLASKPVDTKDASSICSRGMAGILTPAALAAVRDENGTTFASAAAAAGYPNSGTQVAVPAPDDVHADDSRQRQGRHRKAAVCFPCTLPWCRVDDANSTCAPHVSSVQNCQLRDAALVAQDVLKRTRLVGGAKVHAFVELHIEQGPELEAKVGSDCCCPPAIATKVTKMEATFS